MFEETRFQFMSFSASPPKPAWTVLARNAPTGKEEQEARVNSYI